MEETFSKQFTGDNLNQLIGNYFKISIIPANSNLNNYIDSGRYASNDGSVTTTLSNVPEGVGTSFTLIVLPLSGNENGYKQQILLPANRSAFYVRYMQSVNPITWEAWYRIPIISIEYKQKGSTSERPSLNTAVSSTVGKDMYNLGYYYFDTTLGKPIWWNGDDWVDATGTTV